METTSNKKPKPGFEVPTGNWIECRSGRKLDFLDPKPEQISIRDIADHLSKLCRYVGASPFHYSVAEHSIIGSILAPKELKLAFLLHDAHEAYIGDISRPLKRAIRECIELDRNHYFDPIKTIALKIDGVIEKKFGVELVGNEELSDFDNAMLFVEAETFGFSIGDWTRNKLNHVIEQRDFVRVMKSELFGLGSLYPSLTADIFLNYFSQYGGKLED